MVQSTYKDNNELARYHEEQIGKQWHPINPFAEFEDIESEIGKHDLYKKRGRDAFGRERDEDKPEFYNDPLMEKWQYEDIYENSQITDADPMLLCLR